MSKFLKFRRAARTDLSKIRGRQFEAVKEAQAARCSSMSLTNTQGAGGTGPAISSDNPNLPFSEMSQSFHLGHQGVNISCSTPLRKESKTQVGEQRYLIHEEWAVVLGNTRS